MVETEERKLTEEDQQRVDKVLSSGIYATERKPFRPFKLLIVIVAVLTVLSFFSIFIANLYV